MDYAETSSRLTFTSLLLLPRCLSCVFRIRINPARSPCRWNRARVRALSVPAIFTRVPSLPSIVYRAGGSDTVFPLMMLRQAAHPEHNISARHFFLCLYLPRPPLPSLLFLFSFLSFLSFLFSPCRYSVY